MPNISLTPIQAVTLFSWFHPKTTLTWKDIVNNPKLTYAFLRMNDLTVSQLHKIQPDFMEWKHAYKIGLYDIVDMHPTWTVHPIRDMNADLADLMAMQWSPQTLKALGVTYQDIRNLGATPKSMALFRFTLIGWATIGFKSSDLASMDEADIARVFGLTRVETENCFINSGFA